MQLKAAFAAPPALSRLDVASSATCHPRERRRCVTAQQSETEQATGGLNSRLALTALGSVGALETGVLSFLLHNKDSAHLPFCGADSALSSCISVLKGPYSTLSVPFVGTELPVVWLGFGAYASLVALSLAPKSYPKIDDALLALTTAMSAVEAGLIFVLTQQLHASCLYCGLSAAITWASWGITAASAFSSRAYSKALRSMLGGLAIATLAGVNAATAGGSVVPPTEEVVAKTPPPIVAESSTEAINLGRQLRERGARMYGAFWCSHCFNQKELLGKEAFGMLEYVECAKDGVDSRYKFCKEQGIPGYPTWEIGGELYPGTQDLQELKDIVELL